MKSFEENSHAFIIRFWLEPREIDGAQPVWRGVIEHVPSGRQLFSKNVDGITTFIKSYLPGIEDLN